jgi:hypothetical protein
MTNAVPPHRRVELLLNTLRAERHLRRPLLLEVLETLSATGTRPAARKAAGDLLERLDAGALDDFEFDRWVGRVLELAQDVRADTPDATAAA